MLETGAARRPHPQLNRELIAEIDGGCQDLCGDAIKGKRLADFAGSKRGAALQRAVVVALAIVCIAVGAPPAREVGWLGDATRGRRRWLSFAGRVGVEDRLELSTRACSV